jgi:hypothetical protein
MRTHVDSPRPAKGGYSGRVQRVFKSPRSLANAGAIGETVIVSLINGTRVTGKLRHVGAAYSGVTVDGVERSFRNAHIKRVMLP